MLGFSYARFVINTDSYRSNEMYMAELLYTVIIDDVSTYTLTIEAGAYEEEHIIEISSLNAVSTNYKLIYQNNSNVKIEYASDYIDPAFGGILTKRTIMLRLTNNSEEDQTLSFSVVGGYSFNSVDEIDIPSGYSEINLEYWKYDYETMALYIDNVRVDSLDENKYYALVNYTCNRDIEVLYNVQNRTITLNSDTQTKCSLYFNEFNPVFDFDYTGAEQILKITVKGYYKLETWGAQGGIFDSVNHSRAGYGGYSKGILLLEKNTNLFINVGGNGIGGSDKIDGYSVVINGGYNGGGNAITWVDDKTEGSGGGATHIALVTGLLSSLSNQISDILIVSGGGGGSASESSSYYSGDGGGYLGNSGYASNTDWIGTGGSQISAGTSSSGTLTAIQPSFGQGGTSYSSGPSGIGNSSGGGGGFYGGGSGVGLGGFAGGGSGYIGNSLLTNKVMYCYNCATSNDESTKTVSNTCANSSPTENCSKIGNGYARITYLGTSLN